jgi:hypothetical protein
MSQRSWGLLKGTSHSSSSARSSSSSLGMSKSRIDSSSFSNSYSKGKFLRVVLWAYSNLFFFWILAWAQRYFFSSKY